MGFFTDHMSFLSPDHQCQSSEKNTALTVTIGLTSSFLYPSTTALLTDGALLLLRRLSTASTWARCSVMYKLISDVFRVQEFLSQALWRYETRSSWIVFCCWLSVAVIIVGDCDNFWCSSFIWHCYELVKCMVWSFCVADRHCSRLPQNLLVEACLLAGLICMKLWSSL